MLRCPSCVFPYEAVCSFCNTIPLFLFQVYLHRTLKWFIMLFSLNITFAFDLILRMLITDFIFWFVTI